MQKELNLKIEFRKSRPAPSILEAEADKWFDLNLKSLHDVCIKNQIRETI